MSSSSTKSFGWSTTVVAPDGVIALLFEGHRDESEEEEEEEEEEEVVADEELICPPLPPLLLPPLPPLLLGFLLRRKYVGAIIGGEQNR